MCNRPSFHGTQGLVQVALPVAIEELIAGWNEVRSAMLKDIPADFRRDEWAYLATFLDIKNLHSFFEGSFGSHSTSRKLPALLARPRGSVGLWLPNNVSLLGPLMLIVVSLTGNELRVKSGSRSTELLGVFLEFARSHAGDGPLSAYLGNVRHEIFSSDDPRNREMAERSSVRIVFGSNEAVYAIHCLPHPVDSIGISFADRRSEAWVEPQRCDDNALRDLIRAFAVYGQAGCTSPSRAILLNGNYSDALEIRNRILDLWPSVIAREPEMNIASENVRACQMARAAGWESKLVAENRAVLSLGDYSLPVFPSLMELRIIPATIEEACLHLPENIQTIGHALENPCSPKWLQVLSRTKVARFVPLARMHHFETFWDGQDFFAQLFTYTRVEI